MANMKKLLKRMKKAIREANAARDDAHAAANEIADLIATYHPLHAPEPESPDPWLDHLPDDAAAAPDSAADASQMSPAPDDDDTFST
jgi:hypothetical protein